MEKIKQFVISHWILLTVLLIAAIFMLTGISKEQFWDWDECIYVQYGKTMKETGNFLTAQWLGQLRLEKPPLLFWLLQIPFSIVISEFSARILSVLATLGLFVSVYFFSLKYFSKKTAILSTLLLATANTLVVYFTRVNTDIFYTLFLFLAFFAFVASSKKTYFSYIAGLFFAAAVMIKGLGITPFLAAIFLSIFIDFKKENLFNFIRMVTVMTLVILPWHLYEYINYGQEFIKVYIVENLIQKLNNPVEFHFGGRLYYFNLLIQEFLPWLAGIIILPIYYLFNLRKLNIKKNKILFAIILLIVIPFIAITRTKTKIAWYIMPIYPFLIIYIAYSFDFILSKIKKKNLTFILSTILFVLIALDAFKTFSKETKFLHGPVPDSARNEVAIAASKFPQTKVDYLVQASERTAKDLLNQSPNLYTSTTFIYGGNACAVYYSKKHINYYYSVDEFKKRLQSGPGLYIIENGDLHLVKGAPIEVLYKNSDFTLFKN